MTYQKDRDEFLHLIQQEGLSYQTATKLLRYAQTLHRLAIAECNGDWPADNGERKVKECPRCGSSYDPSSFKVSTTERVKAGDESGERYNSHNTAHEWALKICPDCRTRELVGEVLFFHTDFKAVFNGDPRGCVLKIQVPSGKTNDWGREGICVPVRDR